MSGSAGRPSDAERTSEQPKKPDGRRTDTRERIRATALEVFSEHGWNGTTLTAIADRLGVTRPAVYHHFASKEEILRSLHDEFATAVRVVIDKGRARPAGADSRRQVVQDIAELTAGSWGPFLRLTSDPDVASVIGAPEGQLDSLAALVELLSPADSVYGRYAALAALDALLSVEARRGVVGGSAQERHRAALEVGRHLIS